MNSPIFVPVTGTPTARAAAGSPPAAERATHGLVAAHPTQRQHRVDAAQQRQGERRGPLWLGHRRGRRDGLGCLMLLAHSASLAHWPHRDHGLRLGE